MTFGTGVLMCIFGWDLKLSYIDYLWLGSEISRSQVCHLGSKTLDRHDYLRSDVSSI